MRRAASAPLIAAALLPVTLCVAEVDPAALLERARAGIRESVAGLTKYTCVQTVQRSRFDAFYGDHKGGCVYEKESAAGNRTPLIMLAWTDRLKLDVTVADGGEMFSWAGAREFQSSEVQEIVGGGLTGTGDFGPFLSAVFGKIPAATQYLGTEQFEGKSFAAYSYRVPKMTSRYQLKMASRAEDFATLAYEGKFWIDPRTAGLERLTIVVPQPPAASETCRIETTINYQRVGAAGSRLLLPRSTLLELWDMDGSRYENRIAYTGCRAFQSESVFRAEAAAPVEVPSAPAAKAAPVPPGLQVQIALRSRIDVGRAFAGDEIEGWLLHALRGRGGRLLAAEGTLVHGRIVRLEQHHAPSRYLVLGLQFYSLDVDGRETPLVLEAVSRSREERLVANDLDRRKGIGSYLLLTSRQLVEGTLVTTWKTRAR